MRIIGTLYKSLKKELEYGTPEGQTILMVLNKIHDSKVFDEDIKSFDDDIIVFEEDMKLFCDYIISCDDCFSLQIFI